MNLQDTKVGNAGDILKHAALVDLGRLIQRRNPDKRVCYLDTNAYRLESVCSNSAWNSEISRFIDLYGDGYVPYRDIEARLVAEGRYLCSPSLAMSVLEKPHLFLAESNLKTHALLSL